MIKDIILFGNPKDICNYLPTVTVEFYDKDTVVRKSEYAWYYLCQSKYAIIL